MTGFVPEAADGEAVLCLHGVPTSSFLDRAVLEARAGVSLRLTPVIADT